MQWGEIQLEIKALPRLGWSVSDIAREYDLSRTTVYAELASPLPRHYGRAHPTALADPQLVHVERRLAVCPTLRGTDLYAELCRDYGFRGSYPAFARHLRLLRCLEDLGGVTRDLLTDRDPAFCIGATGDGGAILAPEWVDFATLLGVVPRACRPYRAKTKGKVERMIRALKEGFLGWLSGQLLPPFPTIADYDALARLWIGSSVKPGSRSGQC